MSASGPKVSIVMAVRDGAAYLPAALDSIFAQTFADFELIVIDDGSRDSTAGILASCRDHRLVCLHYDSPLGLGGALNRGLEIAKGAYVARHDADDMSHQERLKRQVDILEAEADLVILGTAYGTIDSSGRYIETQCQPKDDLAIRWQMLFHNAFCHSSVLLRRSTLVKHGLTYDESLSYAQDYDLWSRLLAFGKGQNLSAPLVSLRLHEASMSGTGKPRQQAIADRVAQRNIENLLGEPVELVEAAQLRACYYTLPERLALPDDRLLRRFLGLCKIFAARHGNAGFPPMQPRYWIERFMLKSAGFKPASFLTAFRASPLCAARAVVKLALGR